MAEYKNCYLLQGEISSNKELKITFTKNGDHQCYFYVKTKLEGEKKFDYIPIKLWKEYADNFVRDFQKDDFVYIQCVMRRTVDSAGHEHLKPDFVKDSYITLIERPEKKEGGTC